MDVRGYGGPFQGSLHACLYTPTRDDDKSDKTYFRSPESRALQQCKNEIESAEKWDDFKKITNPYEYVFLSWNRRSSRSVSMRQPLSRSYYKMIEMWKTGGFTHLLDHLVARDGGLFTAHAAEGPGGFIEACWEHAAKESWTVKQSFAITLRSEARNVPGWRKAVRFLAEHHDITILDGADGTGNILVEANQDAFVAHVRAHTPQGAHVYTADGGFDFSADYDSQEDIVFPLLVAESLIAIRSLTVGGCMILKCFDTTERPTLDLLWLLCQCFREWRIVKPHTSRAGNAERYFMGLGFVGHVEDVVAVLKGVQARQQWRYPILKMEAMPTVWRDQVLAFQEQVEQMEYRTIRQTLDLIHTHDYQRIRNLVRENIKRSIQWCLDFEEPVSSAWSNVEFERNVSKEAHDLLQILSPDLANSARHHAWYSRPSTVSIALSFQGFRTERVEPVYTNPQGANPFTRY